MRFSLTSLLAFAAPIFAQSTTPAPTTTDNWWGLGPPWATTDPAKWSSVYNSLVSAGRIPSTLTAAPWPTDGPWGPGGGWGPGGNWGPGGGHGPGGPGGPGHWGGPSGVGPWGSSFPWSGWTTRSDWKSDWRNGPWTAWWGGSACPPSDWPGWTAGPWSTAAPWTSWSSCTAKTTATSVITRSGSGTTQSAQVSTVYGLQVQQASGTPTQGSSTGAGDKVTAGLGAVVAAAVLGLAVGL